MERLLHQCRVVLLQYSNEQLNMLFVSWFERMIGEEYMDEALGDRRFILSVTSSDIKGWRSKHQALIRERRKAAAQAAASRKAKLQEEQMAYQG